MADKKQWQSDINNLIKQNPVSIDNIKGLILLIKMKIKQGKGYIDVASNGVKQLAKAKLRQLYTMGTKKGDNLAKAKANSNYYIDHPVYGRLRYWCIYNGVYNINGKLINTLYSGIQSAGNHNIKWDATNSASSLYLLTMTADNFVENKKLMLIK